MPCPNATRSAILRAVKKVIASPAKKATRATSFEPSVADAVGRAMRATREDRGHAQDALALLAGVDRSYYGKLERGERQPTVGLLLRVAYALGVSGSDLLKSAEILLADKARTTDRKMVTAKSSTTATSSARAPVPGKTARDH